MTYLLESARHSRGLIAFSRSRVIAALAALVPAALVVPALVTSLAATLVVVAVAVWETCALRGFTPQTATG